MAVTQKQYIFQATSGKEFLKMCQYLDVHSKIVCTMGGALGGAFLVYLMCEF